MIFSLMKLKKTFVKSQAKIIHKARFRNVTDLLISNL